VYRGLYGYVVNSLVIPERHVTNAVTAVNFDIRALDTLGEEFIMFTAVVGVFLLLRRLKDEAGDESKTRSEVIPPSSDATSALGLMLVGPLSAFGVYIIVHGQLTPGGGFQGGTILAAAPLLVYLAGSFERFKAVVGHHSFEIGEAIGAASYALLGVATMFAGAAFLENILPLGKVGSVLSGGMIPIIDAAVGLEVAGGFIVLLRTFLEERLEGGAEREE
jgi:multicomponent Na+:H+ antiporter subunit B